jgi:hypothetical protein
MIVVVAAWCLGALTIAVPMARVLGRIEQRIDRLHRSHGAGLAELDRDLLDHDFDLFRHGVELRDHEDRLDQLENVRRHEPSWN